MKKIISIIILLVIFSCGKTNSQTQSLQFLKSQDIVLPYGEKDLLYSFPKDWNSGKSVQDSLYNKLHFFVFSDEENTIRKKNKKKFLEAKLFFDKDFVVNNEKEAIEFKTAIVFTSENFKVMSMVYEGKINCNNCEYPESQNQNMLVSISDGKIIDKLLISSIVGSDLGENTRFFYIDSNKTIHLKDFKSDEEGVTFIQYLKYEINSKGKFIRQ